MSYEVVYVYKLFCNKRTTICLKMYFDLLVGSWRVGGGGGGGGVLRFNQEVIYSTVF